MAIPGRENSQRRGGVGSSADFPGIRRREVGSARSAALLSGMLSLGFGFRGLFSRQSGRLGHRNRGAEVRRSGQAVLTMSCELALLSGRPCDLPVCAASAYPQMSHRPVHSPDNDWLGESTG